MRDAVAATGRQAVPTFYQVFEGGYLDWLTMADGDIELDEYTLCMAAANAGDLSMLPVGQVDVVVRGYGRAPRDNEVGARERLSVGQILVLLLGGE